MSDFTVVKDDEIEQLMSVKKGLKMKYRNVSTALGIQNEFAYVENEIDELKKDYIDFKQQIISLKFKKDDEIQRLNKRISTLEKDCRRSSFCIIILALFIIPLVLK